jgi:hypothetical protein
VTALWTIDDNDEDFGPTLVSPMGTRCRARDMGVTDGSFAALVADVRAARLADDMAEQFIITAGTNIYGSVGPFPSIAAAEDYYRANQPQGAPWLTEPTIIRLLRPAPVGEVAALHHVRQQEGTDG